MNFGLPNLILKLGENSDNIIINWEQILKIIQPIIQNINQSDQELP